MKRLNVRKLIINLVLHVSVKLSHRKPKINKTFEFYELGPYENKNEALKSVQDKRRRELERKLENDKFEQEFFEMKRKNRKFLAGMLLKMMMASFGR